MRPLWSYQFKSSSRDLESGQDLRPKLKDGSMTEFDPGERPFGVFVSNAQFHDSVFSEPGNVAAHNPRLAKQPYKAMIYPNKDRSTGKLIPNSYVIGWEYSTNDDFQDVVCQIDNVVLLPFYVKGKP
jgi:hypothetical protein